MLGYCLDNVRRKKPLIHNITNYVTANDVANCLLAIGASPIMADEVLEAEDITAMADGLHINLGTLKSATIKAMEKAGKKANDLHHPVLLDPVGAGASQLRSEVAHQLLENIHFTVIRGNISELKSLFSKESHIHGVDAGENDKVTKDNLNEIMSFLKAIAKKTNSVIAVTGEIDLVSDEEQCYIIDNGRAEMGRITGTGCQLSGLMTAFLAANQDTPLEAAAAAVICMGASGEIGWSHMHDYEGNATYRNRIIDAIYHMNSYELEKRAKYEIR